MIVGVGTSRGAGQQCERGERWRAGNAPCRGVARRRASRPESCSDDDNLWELSDLLRKENNSRCQHAVRKHDTDARRHFADRPWASAQPDHAAVLRREAFYAAPACGSMIRCTGSTGRSMPAMFQQRPAARARKHDGECAVVQSRWMGTERRVWQVEHGRASRAPRRCEAGVVDGAEWA